MALREEYSIQRRLYRIGWMRIIGRGSKDEECIWETGDTMYYHGEVTDPDYCVL